MYKYEAELLKKCISTTTILISAHGLSTNFTTHLINQYNTPIALCILLNFTHTTATNLTSLSIAARKEAYKKGGVVTVTTRCLITDIFNGVVNAKLISALIIDEIHSLQTGGIEEFIVCKLREVNTDCKITAITENAFEMDRIGRLDTITNILQTSEVVLLPRFCNTVLDSFNFEDAVKIRKIRKSSFMDEIETLLFELFSSICRNVGIDCEIALCSDFVCFDDDVNNFKVLMAVLYDYEFFIFYAAFKTVYGAQIEIGGWISNMVSHVLMEKCEEELFFKDRNKTAENGKEDEFVDVNDILKNTIVLTNNTICNSENKIEETVEDKSEEEKYDAKSKTEYNIKDEIEEKEGICIKNKKETNNIDKGGDKIEEKEEYNTKNKKEDNVTNKGEETNINSKREDNNYNNEYIDVENETKDDENKLKEQKQIKNINIDEKPNNSFKNIDMVSDMLNLSRNKESIEHKRIKSTSENITRRNKIENNNRRPEKHNNKIGEVELKNIVERKIIKNRKLKKLIEIAEEVKSIVLVFDKKMIEYLEKMIGSKCMTHSEFKFYQKEQLEMDCIKRVIFYSLDLGSIRRCEWLRVESVELLYFADSLEEQKYLLDLRYEKDAFESLIEKKSRLPLNLNVQSIGEEEDNAKLEIQVDIREMRSSLPFVLYKQKHKIEISTLNIGDYLIGSVCVERKSVLDLLHSLNGRLYTQLCAIKAKFKTYFLLLEFEKNEKMCLNNYYEYNSDRIKVSVLSKFILLLLHFDFKLIWTNNDFLTVKMFEMVNERFNIKNVFNKEENKLTEDVKVELDPNLLEILLNVDGIDQFNVFKILAGFKNLKEMANSSLEKLNKIVGLERGKKIHNFFNRRM